METQNYTVRIIMPSIGYKLTQVADVDIKDRIITNKIYLAANDSPDNYKEITDAEAEAILNEQERIAREEAENNQPE